MANNNKDPINTVRIGNVRAAIWLNEGKNGPWYNVTVARLYQDGSEFRDSNSYSVAELLAAAKAADMAHTWCIENKPTAS